MKKVDYLNECMSEFKGAPIDAFNKEFCALCSNRECSRSWGNASVFDSRVKNWRSFLFENVQRSNDPNIANPNFMLVGSRSVPEMNTPTFETIPSKPPTEDKSFLSYEDVSDTSPDVSDTSPDVSDTSPSPPMENTEPVIVPIPENVRKDSYNTPFDKPMMLQGPKEKPEEETEQPGCVFVFDDE